MIITKRANKKITLFETVVSISFGWHATLKYLIYACRYTNAKLWKSCAIVKIHHYFYHSLCWYYVYYDDRKMPSAKKWWAMLQFNWLFMKIFKVILLKPNSTWKFVSFTNARRNRNKMNVNMPMYCHRQTFQPKLWSCSNVKRGILLLKPNWNLHLIIYFNLLLYLLVVWQRQFVVFCTNGIFINWSTEDIAYFLFVVTYTNYAQLYILFFHYLRTTFSIRDSSLFFLVLSLYWVWMTQRIFMITEILRVWYSSINEIGLYLNMVKKEINNLQLYCFDCSKKCVCYRFCRFRSSVPSFSNWFLLSFSTEKTNFPFNNNKMLFTFQRSLINTMPVIISQNARNSGAVRPRPILYLILLKFIEFSLLSFWIIEYAIKLNGFSFANKHQKHLMWIIFSLRC